MEAARALLDSLMGHRRDEKRDKARSGESFLDESVCKKYLVGFCPTKYKESYFRGKECAKRRIQECTLVHSDAAREELERHPDYERLRNEYEQELLEFLDKIATEADNIVRREKQLARPLTPTVMLKDTSSKEVQKWEEEIKELIKRSEDLAEEGRIAESQACLDKARVNQKQIDLKKASYTFMCGEQVCDVCGLRFVVGDSREDKTNSETHKRSRMHTGYALIREKAEELRVKLRRRAVPSAAPLGKPEPEGSALAGRPQQRESEERQERRHSRSRERRQSRSRSNRKRQRSRSRRQRRRRSRSR